MYRILITFVYLIILINSYSQNTFIKEFGKSGINEYFTLSQDTDQELIIVGSSNNEPESWQQNIWIIKTDIHGKIIWEKKFGGKYSDIAKDIIKSENNTIIVVGETENFGKTNTPNIFLLKLNTYGDTIWTKTFGNNSSNTGESVTMANDHGYIILGSSYDSSTGSHDIEIYKVDFNGYLVWNKTIQSDIPYNARKITPTDDDGYLILTDVVVSAGMPCCTHIKLIKIDNKGNIKWTRKLENNCMLQGANIKSDRKGGFIIIGTAVQKDREQDVNTDIYIMKINKNGKPQWKNLLGGSEYETGLDIVQISNTKYIAMGLIEYNNYKSLILYKIKTNRKVIWKRNFGTSGFTSGCSMKKVNDGGIVIVGISNSLFSYENTDSIHKEEEEELFLLKLNKEGRLEN